MKLNKKGNTITTILLTVVITVLVGLVVYLVYDKSKTGEPTKENNQTQEETKKEEIKDTYLTTKDNLKDFKVKNVKYEDDFIAIKELEGKSYKYVEGPGTCKSDYIFFKSNNSTLSSISDVLNSKIICDITDDYEGTHYEGGFWLELSDLEVNYNKNKNIGSLYVKNYGVAYASSGGDEYFVYNFNLDTKGLASNYELLNLYNIAEKDYREKINEVSNDYDVTYDIETAKLFIGNDNNLYVLARDLTSVDFKPIKIN